MQAVSQTKADTVFNEKFMGLVSLAIVPFFIADLVSTGAEQFIFAAEFIIVIIFLAEYGSKLYAAKDKAAFVRSGWQILNLFVILSFFGGIGASLLLASGVLAPSPVVRLLRLVRLGMFATRAAGALRFHKMLAQTRFYHMFGVSVAVIFLGAYGFLVAEPSAASLLASFNDRIVPSTAPGAILLSVAVIGLLVLLAMTVSHVVKSFGASDKSLDDMERDIEKLKAEVERLRSSKSSS
ncbi:MAG: ion transporter [Candidatus Bathyarchaeia archaeon]